MKYERPKTIYTRIVLILECRHNLMKRKKNKTERMKEKLIEQKEILFTKFYFCFVNVKCFLALPFLPCWQK